MGSRRFIYPATLEPQPGGGFSVTFPDIPEAITEGANRAAALSRAADSLAAALSAYIDMRRPFPVASRRWPGQVVISVSVARLRAWRKATPRPGLVRRQVLPMPLDE